MTLAQTPAAATPLSIAWAPSGDPDVTIDVRVQCTMPLVDWDSQSAITDFDATDTGSFTIPADAFPSSGSYLIGLTRGTRTTESVSFVGLISIASVVSVTL